MEEKPNKVFEERNATLDDDTPEMLDEGALQDELLDESGLNGFQKFIARMDEKKWVTTQIVAGSVMGIIAAFALFWDELIGKAQENTSNSLFTVPLVVAIVVAMILPNIIEKQGRRSAPKLRIALVIALLVGIVLYIGSMLIFKKG